MKIRCLAVDDEAYAARIIADHIGKVPFLQLVGTCTNAIEALALVQQGEVDLVFLDIQMPDLSGIQFLKLCGNKCKVILTTAYPEYALEGYEHDVVDYLLKPVPFDRFLKAAQKAWQQMTTTPQLAFASVPASTPAQPGIMFVKGDSKNKFIKVDLDDVLYIEGLKNYVSIFVQGQRIITYQTLRDLEDQLSQPAFCRVHRSYIVAVNKIRLIDGHMIYIQDQAIPVGDTYREAFYKLIREEPT